MMLKKIILIIIGFTLLSCKTHEVDNETIIPATHLYSKGIELLMDNKYIEGAEEFSKVYFQHPGGELTPYAELMEAYCWYQAGKYYEVADIIDNFIKIHPLHEDIAYAFYLKALAYYMQIGDTAHDQGVTVEAKFAFEEVIKRFPGTKYALDAALKVDLVNDHLAGSEIAIGRFYQNQQNPVGAINRFQIVIEKYNTTAHTPEAVYRLVESFTILGLKEEAKKYIAVLAYNYPNSNWYKYAKQLVK